jgi:hypothetical protein
MIGRRQNVVPDSTGNQPRAEPAERRAEEDDDPVFDWPRHPHEFDEETRNEFMTVLGIGESEFEEAVLPELQGLAASYRRWIAQTDATPKRAKINRELKKLATDARAFAQRLKALDDDVLFEAMRRFGPEEKPGADAGQRQLRHERLADEIDRFARAMERAHAEAAAQTGPDRNMDLAVAVQRLVELYEHVTDKPVTHSAAKGSVYDGTPRSDAGRFVLAFIRSVDPRGPGEGRLKDTTISTELAKFIRHRNSRRPGS